MSKLWPDDAPLGIHSVDHFALEVPSLDEAEKFFTTFGLRVQRTGQHLELRASASDHVWGRLFQGERKRLAYLSVSCHAEQLEALTAQVKAHGGQPVTEGPYVQAGGFWFRDSDGNLLQLKAGPKCTPAEPAVQKNTTRLACHRAVQGRSQTPQVHPRRLSHLLLFTSNIHQSVAFYMQALGLRMSDQSSGIVAFLHGRHGSDHHLIAMVQSEARGLHHTSWDMASLDEVGRGGEQMRDAGYKLGWGTGRHVLGSNYFHYVRDPWGSYAEYSADIDFIPAGHDWPAGDHPPEDSFYLWGPEVPSYFVENTEK